jgi:hypothetical protein
MPQRWQNFAPGVSDAAQPAHVAPWSEAPQLEQNFPDAVAPQLGQVWGGDERGAGMGES